MKNFLAPIMQNKVVTSVSKFYVAHESAILTGGVIGFSLATTTVAMKNATEINYILTDARDALNCCNTDEEKKQIYALSLKKLAPLVAPIIIFQTATIGCAIFAKKQSDKRIAELAGALTVAQQAVSYYQAFQKDAEEALGEKKYAKLQEDIYKNQEVDGRRFTALASEGAPGDVLMIDKYSGRPFWCSTDRVVNAAKELGRMLTPSGGNEMVTIDDFYGLIGNIDLTYQESALATRFGYLAESSGFNDISARFADTHYRFPNGTVIPAFEMYLYPEPCCIDVEC